MFDKGGQQIKQGVNNNSPKKWLNEAMSPAGGGWGWTVIGY